MLSTLALLALPAFASSHREAPAISLDPAADLTDFYAFVSPEDANTAVFILNVTPLEAPGGGPNFHRFDDNVLYEIHVDNEGDGEQDITFQFQFETTYGVDAFGYETFIYNIGDVGTRTKFFPSRRNSPCERVPIHNRPVRSSSVA